MADDFAGEIRPFAARYVPEGWLVCDGRELPISQYQKLAAVLDGKFGGNPRQGTFCIPNLLGLSVVGPGVLPSGRSLAVGDKIGSESVVLQIHELEVHTHSLEKKQLTGATKKTAGPQSGKSDIGALSDATKNWNAVNTAQPHTALAAGTVGVVGANQPHENRQPFIGLIYAISHDGEFPIRRND